MVLAARELPKHEVPNTHGCTSAFSSQDTSFLGFDLVKSQRDNENICLRHFMINCKEAWKYQLHKQPLQGIHVRVTKIYLSMPSSNNEWITLL